LTRRKITDDEELLTALLRAASAEVRNAAGSPIKRATFTAKIPGVPRQWLTLPGQPVTDVSEVKLDGEPVTDYRLVGRRLVRRRFWQAHPGEPSEVTVTMTGGMAEVPDDIVDLVCAMVGHALSRINEGGYETRHDLIAVRVDDYSEQYRSTAEERLAGVMELPRRTRERL